TVSDVIDEYFSDPRLKGLAGVMWPYPGSVPSRLSFVTFATTVSVYLDGGFYCEGSFQKLADAFGDAVLMHGGAIRTQTLVSGISVEDDRVTGVVLDDGTAIEAGVVVSNADARKTMEELIAPDRLPAQLLKKTRRMKPSLSAVMVFAATSMDLAQF